MTPATITRRLNRITRCHGCGGWRYHHADYRPCRTCRLLGLAKAMEEVRCGA